MSRRDTPHYLKNKRIQEPLDKEKAMALITNALKKKEATSQSAVQEPTPQQATSSSNQSEDDDDRLPTPPPPPEEANEVRPVTFSAHSSFFLDFFFVKRKTRC